MKQPTTVGGISSVAPLRIIPVYVGERSPCPCTTKRLPNPFLDPAARRLHFPWERIYCIYVPRYFRENESLRMSQLASYRTGV